MATFKPVVFSTKNHIKSDGTTNIKIRVYHNKELQYIPTDYYIKPSFMCSDGTISPIYPDADLFNYELSEVIQKYRKAALKIGSARSSNMSCSEFRDFIVQSVKPDYGYIDFVKFCGDITIPASIPGVKATGSPAATFGMGNPFYPANAFSGALDGRGAFASNPTWHNGWSYFRVQECN